MMTSCSCGESAPHVIAKRETADGIGVWIWHDGAITGRHGRALHGVPVARPRTERSLTLARAIAALISDVVSMYDAAELERLFTCAKRVAVRGGTCGNVCSAFETSNDRTLAFMWVVYATDASGRPTARVARLDRIRWPGLAVWHESGRYELMAIRSGVALGARSREALESTGFSFSSQRELSDHLLTVQPSALHIQQETR